MSSIHMEASIHHLLLVFLLFPSLLFYLFSSSIDTQEATLCLFCGDACLIIIFLIFYLIVDVLSSIILTSKICLLV